MVAYFLGSALIIGLIAWLYSTGASLDQLPAAKLQFPGPDTPKPLLFFSLTLLPLLGLSSAGQTSSYASTPALAWKA